MVKIFLLLIVLGVGGFFLFHNLKKAAAEWFDQNWLYRQAVTVTVTSSSSDVSNLDTWFTMNTSALISANKLQSGCQDLRFTNANGKLLPYFIDSGCNTTTTKIWVRIDLVPKNSTIYTLYVYYGNPSASAGSDSNKFNLYNGLVGYWNMNEPSWTNNCSTLSIKDFSVNGNNGKSCPNGTGPMGGATGKYGNAGSFNGTSNYLDVGGATTYDFGGTQPFSLAAWVNPTVSSGGGDVISKYNGGVSGEYILTVDYDGTVVFHREVSPWELTTGPVIMFGQWNHIVANYDGSTMRIYVNGVLAGSMLSGSENTDTVTSVKIGAEFTSGSPASYFPGYIDDVRIYNRALSASEVSQLYSDNSSSILTAVQGQSVPSVSFAAEEVGPGPVAYWKFDEGQGQTAYDSSSNKNNGTLGNSTGIDAYDPTWVTNDQCVSGKCLKFDGSASFVNPGTGSSLNITNAITVEAWVNPAQWAGVDPNEMIIYNRGVYSSNNQGFLVGLLGQNLWFQLGNGSTFVTITSSSNYSINKFQHVVFTWDGSTMKMYINGVQDATTGSITGSISYYVTTARIGAEHWGYNARVFNGFIDDVKIYPYARTAAQIQADYNARGSGFGTSAQVGNQSAWMTNGLVGYWKMDETSGTSVADSSGGNNTGTLTNAQESRAAMTGSTLTTISDTGNANLSGTDNVYNGMILSMSGASCNVIGQQQTISGYTASTKTITVSQSFSAIPSTTNCTYTILHQAGGVFGNGLHFDGIDDYVNAGNSTSLNFTTAMTAGAWIKTTDSNANIISKGYDFKEQFNFYISGGQLVVYGSHDGSAWDWAITGPTGVNDGKWHYCLFTFDQNVGMKMYVDGKLVGQSLVTGTLKSAPTIPIGIGYIAAGGNAYPGYQFAGIIDEVRLYNRALSPKEISDLYSWAPGPVGWWKMDDKVSGNSQIIIDSSGYGNNGTTYWGGNASGMNCKIIGKYGGGCLFDGVDDYIDVDDGGNASLLNITGAITIEAWIKPQVVGGVDMDIVANDYQSSYAGYEFVVDDSTKLMFRTDVQGGSPNFFYQLSASSVTASVWQHVAAVYDGANITFYINGVADPPIAASGSLFKSAYGPVYIGKYISAYNPFNGSLDDVRIYNYARNSKQILQDMSAGSPVGGNAGKGYAGYWKFDEGYGTTIHDMSVNANTGTIHGASWTNDGKFGKALNFNGVSSDVFLGNGVSLQNITSALTIEAWVKPSAINRYQVVVDKSYQSNYSGYEFGFESDNTLKFRDNPNSSSWNYVYSSATNLKVNVWCHIAVVYDGANVYFYKDGTLLSSSAAGGQLYADPTSNAVIGSYGDAGDYFQGTIDEVKIYPSALTADDIKVEYNRGALRMGSVSDTSGLSGGSTASNSASAAYCIPGDTTPCKSPVAEWEFDEHTGGYANDTSGNGNTGTLEGTPLPTWNSSSMCHTGSCLKFVNNDDQTINIPNVSANLSAITTSNKFTYEAWIYPTLLVSGEMHGIIGATGYNPHWGYSVGITGDNTLNLTFQDSSGNWYNFYSTKTVSLNKWSHVAVTFDHSAGTIAFYVNGQQDLISNVIVDNNTSPSFIIGNAGWNYFVGNMDEVRVFDYARTPAQIDWDYNRGKPVGWWKFDECQGTTAYDSSGNGNIGAIVIGGTGSQTTAGTCLTPTNGTGAWYNGKVGKYNSAMSFDGTDDYVDAGNNASLKTGTGPFSEEAWVKWSNLTGEQHIVSKGVNRQFYKQNSTNKIYIGSITQGLLSDTTVQSGVWYHVAATYDGTNLGLYVNGHLEYLGAKSMPSSDADNLIIGAHSSTPDYLTSGLIDEVKVYNYALTPQQILLDYNQGSAVRFAPWACGNNITFAYSGSLVTYGTVSHNGMCWMDRNLGASGVATAYNDSNAYGDLFQWGRLADGHQIRTSGTTTTLSGSDNPGNSNFIYGMGSPYDWRSPQNNNLWQGASGVNNPCPSGWGIPTNAEWTAESGSWSSQDYNGAFASPLKLTVGGLRDNNASLGIVGSYGVYWSSTVSGANAYDREFYGSGTSTNGYGRVYGLSVRCVQNP